MRKFLAFLFAFVLAFSLINPVFATEDKDCDDFKTWEEAQRFFEENGGPAKDPHGLDRDGDGLACETLPGFNPNHKPGSFVGDGGDNGDKKDPKPTKKTATVVDVVDGDTIKVKLDGKVETIRFILVDTPETKHPNKPVQPCGPEASAFTKRLVSGKKVELEFDVQERDKYGRLLAYVYVGGKSVQEVLLAEGLAKVSVYPPNVKYVDKYRAIEKKAKEAKKGIWSDKPCAEDDGKGNDDKGKGDGGKGDDKGGATPPKGGDGKINNPGSGGKQPAGGELPKTATSFPLNTLLGALIALAGGALLVARRLA